MTKQLTAAVALLLMLSIGVFAEDVEIAKYDSDSGYQTIQECQTYIKDAKVNKANGSISTTLDQKCKDANEEEGNTVVVSYDEEIGKITVKYNVILRNDTIDIGGNNIPIPIVRTKTVVFDAPKTETLKKHK